MLHRPVQEDARVGRGLAYVPAAAHHDDYPSEQVEPSSPTRPRSLNLQTHLSLPDTVHEATRVSPGYAASVTSHRSDDHSSGQTFFKSIKRAIAKAATAGTDPTYHHHHHEARDKPRGRRPNGA
ncbi:hypothetical protein JCM8202v2_002175 [Rhodotorula sphaerocarpa]